MAVLASGTRLGAYEVRRLLGVGSMGAVYEAAHAETGKHVAVKVLGAALAGIATARARFLAEAKVTARVRHPHIVDVIDVGESAGRSFLVMEMLDGEDLARRLQRGSLSATETADVMVPVCEAVAAAHARGVTHRDLKPSNIFLVEGDHPNPVVLDFGIAKDENGARPAATDPAGPTASRVLFGTPYYLSPEQIADHRAAGPASDQYALGVILYECLTGQRPFGGDQLEDLLRAIAAGKPSRPTASHPDVPEALEKVVLRAMSADRKQRFDSVEDLAQALAPFATPRADETTRKFHRKMSSPAIEVEAATPSPFTRTLTPEVQSESGPWFVAPESSEGFSGETTSSWSGTSTVRDGPMHLLDEPSPRGAPSLFDADFRPRWNPLARLDARAKWIAVASGMVVGVIGLSVVALTGGSGDRPAPAGVPVPATQSVARASAAAPATAPSTAIATPVVSSVPARTHAEPAKVPARPEALAASGSRSKPPVVGLGGEAPARTARAERPSAEGHPDRSVAIARVEEPPARATARPDRSSSPAAAAGAHVERPVVEARAERSVLDSRVPRPASARVESRAAEETSRTSVPTERARPRGNADGDVRAHKNVPLLD